jgi:hypothetical protein
MERVVLSATSSTLNLPPSLGRVLEALQQHVASRDGRSDQPLSRILWTRWQLDAVRTTAEKHCRLASLRIASRSRVAWSGVRVFGVRSHSWLHARIVGARVSSHLLPRNESVAPGFAKLQQLDVLAERASNVLPHQQYWKPPPFHCLCFLCVLHLDVKTELATSHSPHARRAMLIGNA